MTGFNTILFQVCIKSIELSEDREMGEKQETKKTYSKLNQKRTEEIILAVNRITVC